MGQNKNTGREGVVFGRRMAELAFRHLGSELLNTKTKSNETKFNGQIVVLKSAHKNTSSVGVTLNVLENIQSIIAVLENKEKQEDGVHKYTLYKVPVEWYKQHMYPSRSSPSAAKTTRMVNCNPIRKNGEVIGELICDF
ncbi:hypothetical protein [uncultured Methanolobus sp.]|uniref:hypothetical protein n=1 Tax=uncultured Methanolobus sp. TaxID=218300 RepID=UPI002AAB29A1|nr:hypothetical protein [uncultured Methanolobus sp.]